MDSKRIDSIKKNKKINLVLPKYITDIARILEKEGYEAYLVGGSVRDLVIEVAPGDYDIATNAKPENLLKTFPKAVSTGIKYGTVIVLSKDEKGENFPVEVTTYRSEENYVDGRWPAKVEFVDEINKDLGRRDFTINAMAINLQSVDYNSDFDPEKEYSWQLLDLFNGLDDLQIGVIRAVGTPIERFSEDGLRCYRACRLASQLDFEIDRDTFDGIKKSLHVAKRISPERIRDEFMKMLMRSSKPSKGIELMRIAGILQLFIPELLEGIDVKQPKFHVDDVYEHSLNCVDKAEDSVKLAALFHDIAKPRCADGKGHFYGHDRIGAEMTAQIMKRLRFSNDEIKRVTTLIKNHMFYYPFYEEGEGEELQRQDERPGYWTDSAIRRFVRRVGEENIDDLFKLRIADAAANPKSSWDPLEIEALEKRISEVRAQEMALKVTDLDITGHDLMVLGVEKGPQMGKILNALLEMVLDDPGLNKKDTLLNLTRELLQKAG